MKRKSKTTVFILAMYVAQLGWDSKVGETHTDKLMRASVMELLDSFAWDNAAVAAEAKKRFDAHWEDASALPSEYKVSWKALH